MRALHLTVSLLFPAVSVLSAAPKIDTIQNSASNIVSGPGGPLAQGSIFVIKGSGLGPANISIATSPFQNTTLSNTSVAVVVGGTTINALMYYTSDGQIAALLPSNTPTGAGSFTVTYNNQTSPAVVHNIAVNIPGLYTIDSSGQGVGIVTYADYSLVSPLKAANCGGPNTTCGAANPGDTLILWATGLGPIAGTDAKGDGLGVNMPNLPLTVWLGGVQAPVLYQGRSGCCIGEDQIVFTVPAATPLGCAVPLALQIGGAVSNYVVMPVAATGSRTCTSDFPLLTTELIQQAFAAGPLAVAQLQLKRNGNDTGNGFHDEADFEFFKITSLQSGTLPFISSYVADQPLGTCTVFSNTNGNNDVPFTAGSDLNAGATFTLKGPNGTLSVKPTSVAGSSAPVINAAGTYLTAGDYTITGTGGADLGAFTANLTIPAIPTLVSPARNFTLNRANGLTVTWTGGGGTVNIQVVSATDTTFNIGATVSCTALASAGKLTIPPAALLALPPTTFNFFLLASVSAQTPFPLAGVNLPFAQSQITGPLFGGFTIQ